MRMIKQYSLEQFKAHEVNLTIDQWIVFKRIADQDGVSLKKVADTTYKDPASVTRLVDVLVKKEMIVKVMDEVDRRRYNLHLTAMGKQEYQRLVPFIQELRRKGIEDLSKEEVSQLAGLLDRIYEKVLV